MLYLALFADMFRRAYGPLFNDHGELVRWGYGWSDGDWSHALVVPLISLYFIYQHREELRRAAADPNRREAGIESFTLAMLVGFIPGALLGLWLLDSVGPLAARGLVTKAVAAVPFGVVGAGLCYLAREPLRRAFGAHLGLVLLLLGIAGYALGIYPIQNDMAKGYSMILALGGLIWFLCGAKVARLMWFPVAYLAFAVKISDRIWGDIAFRLKHIAAELATVATNVLGAPLGIEADVRGNTIDVYKDNLFIEPPLNVADACAGLRMLATFIALGVAVAYLSDRPWWSRLTLVLLTVPIAVMINAGRVTALGLIHPYNQELTHGEFHKLIGILMLIPALGLFMLVGWVLGKLVITEEPGDRGDASREVQTA
jgi:exosortase